MSNYCELRDNGSVIAKSVAATIAHDYPQLKIYYDTLGRAKIKALDYQESKFKAEYNICSKVSKFKGQNSPSI